MLHRQFSVCNSCPYFTGIDLRFKTLNGVRMNFMDIDLVGEIGKRIRFIAEIKRYNNAIYYNSFYIPAHEYVLLKKVAKCLKCDFYFIVFNGSKFYVSEIDRFEERRKTVIHNGQKCVKFPKTQFRIFDNNHELDLFFFDQYY